MSVQWDGLNEFVADLSALGAKALPMATIATQKTALSVQASAQAFAPVDTGNLRSSISQETRSTGTGVEAEIGPTAEYGIYVELGTSRMAPHAFLGPAFDRHAGEFEDAISQIHQMGG